MNYAHAIAADLPFFGLHLEKVASKTKTKALKVKVPTAAVSAFTQAIDRVLNATTVRMIDEAIESANEDRQHRAPKQGSESHEDGLLDQFFASAIWSGAAEILGETTAKDFRLGLHAFEAITRMPAPTLKAGSAAATLTASDEHQGPVAFRVDMPNPLRRAILELQESTIALMAIHMALFRSQKLDPWMAEHLTARFARPAISFLMVLQPGEAQKAIGKKVRKDHAEAESRMKQMRDEAALDADSD